MDEKLYKKELEFIFNLFPSYQVVGERAYKPGVENMVKFDKYLGSPSQKFDSIHIAGTNGKGSTSHLLASVFASNGYRVGLYTSPHLKDFRERIKICDSNGYQMISQDEVYKFLTQHRDYFIENNLSFFEITTALAFSHFSQSQIDIAIIETGLGGRLDSTNIITPKLSIITNIGFDHCQYLGNTLQEIATEKGGIIKQNGKVLIGEADAVCREVFENIATEKSAEIHFAYQNNDVDLSQFDLQGDYQRFNINCVKSALLILSKIGYSFDNQLVDEGLKNAARNTGLLGRWQVISHNPTTICDTGHNAHGLKHVFNQLTRLHQERVYDKIYIIFGTVVERDLDSLLEIMPNFPKYFITKADNHRALEPKILAKKMLDAGFDVDICESISLAIEQATNSANESDLIFIGGSTYLVAESDISIK